MERRDFFHAFVDAGVNQVHRAVDIGFHAFKRVVFGGGDDFGGGGVDNVIHAVQRAVQAVFVAHVADKKAHALVALVLFCHVPLLHFVAGENDDFFGVVTG